MTGAAVSAYAILGLHYKPTLSDLEARLPIVQTVLIPFGLVRPNSPKPLPKPPYPPYSRYLRGHVDLAP